MGEAQGRSVRVAAAAATLVVVGTLVGAALEMHRGLVLSDALRGHFWPWSPSIGRPSLAPAPAALTDPVWQFVPWIEFSRRELGQGRLPLWNPHQEAGQPLLGNGQSALGSPLLWPALALPLFPGWNLSLLLRILVSAAGGWALARDHGRSRAAALLAASACGLSGPFVAWLEHPQTLTAAGVPWLLLAVRRAARAPSPGGLASVAAATALVLGGGHHETALMAALLAALFLAAEAPSARAAARPVAGAVLGAGLSAWSLLPFLEYLPRSAAWAGEDRHIAPLPLRDLVRFVLPQAEGSHPIEGAAYLSLALLPLAAIGAFAGRRERVTQVFVLSGALLLLPIPAALLAARGLDELLRRARRPALGAAVAFGIAAGCGAELLSAARGVHAVTPAATRRLSTPLLARLAADPAIFRILPLHTYLPANTATSLGLDDLRGYDALALKSFRTERERVGRFRGVPTQTDVVAPWDLLPGGRELDAWNVKYLFLHPQFTFSARTLNEKLGLDLVELASGPEGRLLENRRVRPRARVERDGRDAGEARVLERTPTRWLLAVTAPAGGTLILANAGYPGWEARVDGRRVPIGGGPGRRQEVAVAAGRSQVEIVYRPGSFRLGLVLAALSAALVALPSARRLLQRR